MPVRKVADKRNPFSTKKISTPTFSIGTETGDAITVSVQLKGNDGADLAVRGKVQAYLSADANGDSILPFGPSGGVAAGTDGVLMMGGLRPDQCLVKGTLVIDATPEKFKTTTTAIFRAAGAQYSKTAATAILFTAAHVVTASKFGVILIQVNAAGTVSTKVPAATQAYDSAALALAALPLPDAGKAALGYIAIAAKAATWTANTDDLTNGSDLTTATFVDIDDPSSPTFDLISESDGDIDVVITETKVRTMYLAVIMPDGTLVVSGAIAFA